MTRFKSHDGSVWPVPLDAYDYMSSLKWRDWAWEGLRRNRLYQDDWREHQEVGIQPGVRTPAGALVTRLEVAMLRAEAWALRCFRGSRTPGV